MARTHLLAAAARGARRKEPAAAGAGLRAAALRWPGAVRVGLPARDGACRRAAVHLRGRGGRREGRDRVGAVRAAARARDRGRGSRTEPPDGIDAGPGRGGRRARCRPRSSTSRSGSPTTTARRRPARSRSSRRSCRSGARSQAPPARAAVAAGRGASPTSCCPSSAPRSSGSSARSTRAAAAPSCSTGPTGSGKTEVYLQACAAALERGLGAIVLVPEISLAPQTVGRVRARFGDRVAILHSGLTDAERRDERERIASGEARIVVGARSAVFAPVRGLGADRRRRGARRLLQAGLRPALRRAHARRQARRARGRGRRLRLGDAAAGELGGARAARARRPRRRRAAAGADRRPAPRGGLPAVGAAARASCAASPSGGGKAILLLNRRGVAPALHCRACGATIRCPNCDVALVLHRDGGAALPPLRPRRAVAGACARRAARPSSRASAPGRRSSSASWRSEFPELELIRLDADTAASPEELTAGAAPLRRDAGARCCSARRWSPRATTSRASSSPR